MSEYAITRAMNRFKDLIPDGKDAAISRDDSRVYMFDRHGNVVSTIRQDGENAETLQFRLQAALISLGLDAEGRA